MRKRMLRLWIRITSGVGNARVTPEVSLRDGRRRKKYPKRVPDKKIYIRKTTTTKRSFS